MKIYHHTNHNKLEPNPDYDYNRASQGLGFYFSSDQKDASRYGKNQFARDTEDFRILQDQTTNHFHSSDIAFWLDIIKEKDNTLYQDTIINWGEDEYEARSLMIRSIMQQAGVNPVKQLQAFESELFIRDTAKWNQIAQWLGVDGILIKDPYKNGDKDLVHVIMYC